MSVAKKMTSAGHLLADSFAVPVLSLGSITSQGASIRGNGLVQQVEIDPPLGVHVACDEPPDDTNRDQHERGDCQRGGQPE